MPTQRTAKHFFIPIDKRSTLDLRSPIALSYIQPLCESGLLYTTTELYEMLRDETKFGQWLKQHGYHVIHMIDRRLTCVQEILHDLWRNRYIRKLATGTYVRNGRPTGVVWEINREG